MRWQLALLFVFAAQRSMLFAHEIPVTIHVLTRDSFLPQAAYPARLWRLEAEQLKVVAELGSNPSYDFSNQTLVVISSLSSRADDDLGGGTARWRLAARSWNLSSSELVSDKTIEPLRCNLLTQLSNRPSHAIHFVDGDVPTVFFIGWNDRLRPWKESEAKQVKPSRSGQFETVKEWTLAALDLKSGKSWDLKSDPDTMLLDGPFQIRDRIAYVNTGKNTNKSAWFYNPDKHTLGAPIALPDSASVYIAGMGMIERRTDGEFLVTDQEFVPIKEPRKLPAPSKGWQSRRVIVAGGQPSWICVGKDETEGAGISLFDPLTGNTHFSHRVAFQHSDIRLHVSPSGQTWFVHDIKTNKALIVDTKRNVSCQRDLSIALKDFEQPIIVVSFKE